MPLRKLILGFLWRFALIYGLLILPWPGFSDLYRATFCDVGNALFGENDSSKILHFESHQTSKGIASLDSQIVLGNPYLADNSGSYPVVNLGLSTRSVGWVPTALIIALTLASPIPWQRRAFALMWGILLVQLYIIISVDIYIWNESTEVSLTVLSPLWKRLFEAAQYTLITQLGASFSVPVLIWILIVFRRQDRQRLGR